MLSMEVLIKVRQIETEYVMVNSFLGIKEVENDEGIQVNTI